MPNLQTEGNRYWFFYRQGAGQVGMTQLGAVTVGSPNAKTFAVYGGTFSGPTRCIWGYANGSNPSAGGWSFTPQGGWIATQNGEGPAFTFTWSGPGLGYQTALGYDWANSGITPTEIGTGDPVNWDGSTGEPPPTETIDNHKIGFTLSNPTDQPKDYYIQPTDMNGNPIDDLPFQKVTLAPGESRPFSFSRPGTGTGGSGGAFKVSVIQTDWVADPEFGISKQESLTGVWNSVPHVVPINNASPTPSQQSSGPGTTPTQAPAQQTQVSGEAALTGSQANVLNQNVLNELQRLGATVKASGDVAHSDAQQILGKLAGIGDGQANMDGVEGKLDGVKDSVDGVKEAIDDLKGELTAPAAGNGPGPPPDDGIEEAEGATGILGGMGEKLDLAQGRLGLVVLKFKSAAQNFPSGGGAQTLDFTLNFGMWTVPFNLSKYSDVIAFLRASMLLAVCWSTMMLSIRFVRDAFV